MTEAEWESPVWQSLVDQGRRFIDALRFSKLTRSPGPGKLQNMGTCLLRLMRWMFSEGIQNFAGITPESAERFVAEVADSDLLSEIEFDDETSISHATLSNYANTLIVIHEHRSLMRKVPGAAIAEHPFNGRSANDVAGDHVERVERHLPAMPVEVFNPIIEIAQSWVRKYSADILSLQRNFLRARGATRHYKGNSYVYATDSELLKFRFDLSGSLGESWRQPLSAVSDAIAAPRGKKARGNAGPSSQFKALISDLRDSASILVQAHTGMRISEVLGLRALPRHENGWPACLTSRPSPSGFYEMFFIKGVIFKAQGEGGSDAEWLAGVRPVGATWLPDAVEAILILDRLFAPWRKMYEDSHLIVSLGHGRGPPRGIKSKQFGDAWRVKSDLIRDGQRLFVAQHVTLPKSHNSWLISTHQFRGRWAQDIVEIEPSLTRAVQEQLHHRLLATTETSYVGNDPSLNRILDDYASRHTASVIHDFVYGDTIAAGRMSDTLIESAPSIRAFCDQFGSKAHQVDALSKVLEEDGIRLWRGDHGDCFFQARTARCHYQETGEFDPSAQRPSTIHRTTDLCFSCANWMVFSRHLTYWENRHREYTDIADQNRAAGELGAAMLAEIRAEQARQVCIWLRSKEARGE